MSRSCSVGPHVNYIPLLRENGLISGHPTVVQYHIYCTGSGPEPELATVRQPHDFRQCRSYPALGAACRVWTIVTFGELNVCGAAQRYRNPFLFCIHHHQH